MSRFADFGTGNAKKTVKARGKKQPAQRDRLVMFEIALAIIQMQSLRTKRYNAI